MSHALFKSSFHLDFSEHFEHTMRRETHEQLNASSIACALSALLCASAVNPLLEFQRQLKIAMHAKKTLTRFFVSLKLAKQERR
jgi:hypothetical protein